MQLSPGKPSMLEYFSAQRDRKLKQTAHEQKVKAAEKAKQQLQRSMMRMESDIKIQKQLRDLELSCSDPSVLQNKHIQLVIQK